MSRHRKRRAIRDMIQAAREALVLVTDVLLIIVAGAFAVCAVVLLARGDFPKSVCAALCVRYCCSAVSRERPLR
jgi:hypothetical protein